MLNVYSGAKDLKFDFKLHIQHDAGPAPGQRALQAAGQELCPRIPGSNLDQGVFKRSNRCHYEFLSVSKSRINTSNNIMHCPEELSLDGVLCEH